MVYKFYFVLLTFFKLSHAQLNAQTSVPPELRECYDNVTLLNRDNNPPYTISVLIELIRKIEDYPGTNGNLREISAAILHTYRQDGIQYHAGSQGIQNVLPYSPTYYTFIRHKLLLLKLIPSNNFYLDNNTLTSMEKCTLHHMLSKTIWFDTRGDEGSVCTQLSRYRSGRLPRDLRTTADDNNVEQLDEQYIRRQNQNGKFRQYDPNDDAAESKLAKMYLQRQTTTISQCPIEDGVVHTPWGAGSAGSLIAGIAAGASPQTVTVLDLVKGTVTSSTEHAQLTVDSRYPGTLTGEIAEAALQQGSESSTISVGASGGWNATQARRFYFVQQNTNLEITDTELRGDIDGLVLGLYLQSYLSQFSNLKLSQLLDMYYSTRNGVFLETYRACNRKNLLNSALTTETLISQSYAFTVALDTHFPVRGTITDGLHDIVTTTVNNVINYISNNIDDVECTASQSTSINYRTKTNLYIVLDSSWQYAAIYPAISNIIDNIEVSKFGSSITLISANNGDIIVNKTFSLSEFHSNYTIAKHQSITSGINLPVVFTKLRNITEWALEEERRSNYVGGNGTAILFFLSTINIGEADRLYIEEQSRIMREVSPDFRLIFATASSNHDSLVNVVTNSSDLLQISLTTSQTNVDTIVEPLLNRIQLVSRRIVNPNCGSTYVNTLSGTQRFEDYVAPNDITFYRLHPNYYYESNSNRRLRVELVSGGPIRVCYSRSIEQPSASESTASETDQSIICEQISTGNYEINLENACNGYSTIGSCPPFYVSVQSVVQDVNNIQKQCTDNACRMPYDIKYAVVVQDLGCFSSGIRLVSSFTMLLLSIATLMLQYY